MTDYKGQCHCGNIHFSFSTEEPIRKGLRCTCSICARKGAMMSPTVFTPEQLHIQVKDDSLNLYQFGAKTAKHFFCQKCGIYPFHETARAPGHYRVNLGCIDELDTINMPYDVFDGKNQL